MTNLQVAEFLGVELMGWHKASFPARGGEVQHVWAQGSNPQLMKHNVADWDPVNNYVHCAQAEAKIVKLGRQIRYGHALYKHFSPKDVLPSKQKLNALDERYADVARVAMVTPAQKCAAMVKMIKEWV